MANTQHWLTRERLILYPSILLAMTLAATAYWIVHSHALVDLNGNPLGADFIAFWGASYIGLHGNAADAYTLTAVHTAEKVGVPGIKNLLPWLYPPAYFLIVLPLALLPYLAAFWTFMMATLAGYLLVLVRILKPLAARKSWPVIACIATSPGLWINFGHGQNGFLTAALAGGTLLCLERRPIIAGVLLGLLTFKPQLTLLFPVALLAIGAWRTLLSAALTAIALTAASIAVLGRNIVGPALQALTYARTTLLEKGTTPLDQIASPFAFMRMLGATVQAAYGVQILSATVATVVVWLVWRRSRLTVGTSAANNKEQTAVRNATLISATFLTSPYLLSYDLDWLGLAIAWLLLDGLQQGWRRGDRSVLVAVWLLPYLMIAAALCFNLPIAPPITALLLAVCWRRHRSTTPLRDY